MQGKLYNFYLSEGLKQFLSCLLFEKNVLENNIVGFPGSRQGIQSRKEITCLFWVENYMEEGNVTEAGVPAMERRSLHSQPFQKQTTFKPHITSFGTEP